MEVLRDRWPKYNRPPCQYAMLQVDGGFGWAQLYFVGVPSGKDSGLPSNQNAALGQPEGSPLRQYSTSSECHCPSTTCSGILSRWNIGATENPRAGRVRRSG